MRFVHIADIHLGNRQYNLSERLSDFRKAFENAIRYAMDKRADFVLIAGDLFHSATVEPQAYLDAIEVLGLAKDEGIPVIAVEGNHDRFRVKEEISWLQALCSQGYLILLDFTADQPDFHLTPWDGVAGSYIEFNGLRIIGLPYTGTATPTYIEMLSDAIGALPDDDICGTILVTHAALEGEMADRPDSVSYAQLAPIRDQISYLALGHLHKPFQRDGWAHNPGSLEVCGIDEYRWGKGLLDVAVDESGRFTASHVPMPHRTFVSHKFAVDDYRTPAALNEALNDRLRGWSAEWTTGEDACVVELRLEGLLEFDYMSFDEKAILDAMKSQTNTPLHCLVRKDALRAQGIKADLDDRLSAAELEYSVLTDIAASTTLFKRNPAHWAKVMFDVKDQALNGQSPAEIERTLRAAVAGGRTRRAEDAN
jgi:exonuclease SbcD